MAVVEPFAGVRYNPQRFKLDDVIAPPYDVISSEEQEELYKRSPYNVIRLILGKIYDEDSDSNNRYTRARDLLNKWLDEGALTSDEPAFYLMEQEYTLEDGRVLRRKGILGRVKLEELGKGVKPHERTLDAPKEDRFKLMSNVGGNLSPVFSLFRDPDLTIEKKWSELGEPDLTFTDTTGIPTKVWVVKDPDFISLIEKTLIDKRLYIADGHHRYETALNIKKYIREKENIPDDVEHPADYVMMYLANSEDEGLVILPTHRLLHSLKVTEDEFFRKITPFFSLDYEESISVNSPVEEIFSKLSGMDFPFMIMTRDRVVSLKPVKEKIDGLLFNLPEELRNLNVNMLHRGILEKILGISMESQAKQVNIIYIKELRKGLSLLEEGKGDFLVLMKPLTLDDVEKVSAISERLPQKSTFFYPKVPSGVAFYLFKFNK